MGLVNRHRLSSPPPLPFPSLFSESAVAIGGNHPVPAYQDALASFRLGERDSGGRLASRTLHTYIVIVVASSFSRRVAKFAVARTSSSILSSVLSSIRRCLLDSREFSIAFTRLNSRVSTDFLFLDSWNNLTESYYGSITMSNGKK